VIRQAISCDICGAEKKQTNHWFVAWEQAGELRVSGWNSRNRLRAGSKHLCGQVCLHKLADDFMARVIAGKIGAKAQPVPDEIPEEAPSFSDTSLASAAALQEIETSARLLPDTPAVPVPPAVPALLPHAAGLLALPQRPHAEPLPPIPIEPQRLANRNWRAEAWERERERTQRAGDDLPGHRPAIVPRRISQA